MKMSPRLADRAKLAAHPQLSERHVRQTGVVGQTHDPYTLAFDGQALVRTRVLDSGEDLDVTESAHVRCPCPVSRRAVLRAHDAVRATCMRTSLAM